MATSKRYAIQSSCANNDYSLSIIGLERFKWAIQIHEEGEYMSDIIDFLKVKNAKDEQFLQQIFQKAHSLDEKLEVLLTNKMLNLSDHHLFLAFLTYTQQQALHPQQIFCDVITLPKHQFEDKYAMNWGQVVKLAATFLTILKQQEPQQYASFKEQLNE